MFYPEVLKAYMDQLMYLSGILSRRTVDVLLNHSEYFLKKNEVQKSEEYWNKAQTMVNFIYDGNKLHYKQI